MTSAARTLFGGLTAAILLALGVLALSERWDPQELDPDIRRTVSTAVRALSPHPGALALPLRDGSVRFAVIGDSGRGSRAQREVADQMVAWRGKFPFSFVLMLGDNVYDASTPADYRRKFERPYAALLDAGVTFYAAIGNHDDPAQINYANFNMGGRRYYSFTRTEASPVEGGRAGVRFIALDSRSFDPGQLAWLRAELARSRQRWKIVFLHHPLYTSGRYRQGARALRHVLEPILVGGDVDVVLAGHEHVYERILPQRGIVYFTSGAAGSLRRGDLRRSLITARGFDRDYHFMLMELSGGALYFQAISRTGETVDAGVISHAHD